MLSRNYTQHQPQTKPGSFTWLSGLPPTSSRPPALTHSVLATHASQFLSDAEDSLVTEHLHKLSPLLGPPHLPVSTSSHSLSELELSRWSSSSAPHPQYTAISLGHHPEATASVECQGIHHLSLEPTTRTWGPPFSPRMHGSSSLIFIM